MRRLSPVASQPRRPKPGDPPKPIRKAGRPKGSKQRFTIHLMKEVALTREAVVQYLTEKKRHLTPAQRRHPERYGIFNADAHAFFMCIYMDESMPLDLRLEAARGAIGYEKPKLAAIDVGNRAGQVFNIRFVPGDENI